MQKYVPHWAQQQEELGTVSGNASRRRGSQSHGINTWCDEKEGGLSPMPSRHIMSHWTWTRFRQKLDAKRRLQLTNAA